MSETLSHASLTLDLGIPLLQASQNQISNISKIIGLGDFLYLHWLKQKPPRRGESSVPAAVGRLPERGRGRCRAHAHSRGSADSPGAVCPEERPPSPGSPGVARGAVWGLRRRPGFKAFSSVSSFDLLTVSESWPGLTAARIRR